MPLCFYKQEKKKNGKNNGKTNRRTMGTNNLSTHRRGVILRGICGGAALKDKSPQISEDNTVITCGAGTQYLGYLCHIERCRSLRAAGQVRL